MQKQFKTLTGKPPLQGEVGLLFAFSYLPRFIHSRQPPRMSRDQRCHRFGGTCRTGGVSRAHAVPPLEVEWRRLSNTYTNPVLRCNLAEYQRLVRRRLEIGMCDLPMYRKEKIGLFEVRKHAGKRQRLIVDVRRSKERVKSPLSAAGFDGGTGPDRYTRWHSWNRRPLRMGFLS